MTRLCLIFLFLVLSCSLLAQPAKSRQKMERERQAIKKELRLIQSAYQQVKGRREETLGQLGLLQRKMTVQAQYISNIHDEIGILSGEIKLSNEELIRLQQQLDTLKAQYARSLVYAYKNLSAFGYLNFLFSAISFNDALKRVRYLRAYRSYRQQQADFIVQTRREMEEKKQELLGKKTEKDAALDNRQQQLQVLAGQKKEKDRVAAKLQVQEKALQQKIALRKKRDAQLRNAIAVLVRREVAAARKAALAKKKAAGSGAAAVRTKASSKSTVSVLVATPRDIALNAGFENNRGRLPWPVDKGHVSVPFGRSKWEGGLEIDNPSLTIATPAAGQAVKAVFDGEVSSVANLGDGLMVAVKHGKYFTIYGNLSSVTVRKGASVRSGQVLGRAGASDEGRGGQVEFMVINETKNVNPLPWLRR
ncbi:peptidoglycan DD-metalloendopeptidase family protein [Paraflavisolibacter sp. H34]|uniref:murein hydrolase activator EnvC family protein n=1 Tax=Huijunlia imazamoxiresistens TaxID=3127457 RepID=UPI0030180DF0